MKTVLLLGGTTEAIDLAQRIVVELQWRVITSLAGRTRQPRLSAGEQRSGGFNGSAGLRDYISQNSIDIIVDATHPFATTISQHALTASKALALPYLRLQRPAWQKQDGDIWHKVADIPDAAQQLPSTAKSIFLATGHQQLEYFAEFADKQFYIRLIEAPAQRLALPNYELILARGPFTEAAETALFRHYQVDLIISKNSGGTASYGKIAAARTLQIPVIMVQRPATDTKYSTAYTITAESVQQALLCLTRIALG